MIAQLDILPTSLAWGMPGAWEIVLVLLVVLLLFGGKKLPELAKGLARGLKTFKSELSDVRHSIEDAEEPAKKPDVDSTDTETKSSDASDA